MDFKVILPDPHLEFVESVLKNRSVSLCDLRASSLEPPGNMKDATIAAERIVKAIEQGEKVVLYTDYDADGFGCGVVFTELMRKIPYNNFALYFNTRSGGFGMNKNGVDVILEKYPDVSLIVTSDNGIVAFDATDYAISKGIDVIITDHHLPDPSGRLPSALAVVDPHREDEACAFRDLCGTGVIYKVMCLVYYLMCLEQKPLIDVLDIVAVATVADMVPLRGENRTIAKTGLSQMSQEARPQWTAFKNVASNKDPIVSFTSKDIGFFIGPCINACSRLHGDIREPLTAFLKKLDRAGAEEQIRLLAEINEQRKEIQRERRDSAFEMLNGNTDDFIVVGMDECEEGVVGLVAGDVCNKFYRPAIVLARTEEGNLKGSGRSIDGIHLMDVLNAVNEKDPSILLGYGGHAQACGLTIRGDALERFRVLLNDACASFSRDVFVKKFLVDYVVKDTSEFPRLYAQKSGLEPFGQGFPEPLVMISVRPTKIRLAKEKHLIFGVDGLDLLCWNSAHLLGGRSEKDIIGVTAIGTIERSNAINCDVESLQLVFAE